jgi:hypothetical protein
VHGYDPVACDANRKLGDPNLMALLALTRVTATVPDGGTYTPNCLLSGAFVITFLGSGTIAAPTMIADGTIIMIRIIMPVSSTAVIQFDPAAYRLFDEQVHPNHGGVGLNGGSIGWFLGYENGLCFKIAGFGY